MGKRGQHGCALHKIPLDIIRRESAKDVPEGFDGIVPAKDILLVRI